MIPTTEIKEKARELSVPVSTIERDYAQNWLLAYLDSIDMALKGGTGIRKVFIEDYRFSDDLDFTMVEALDKDTLKALIRESVIRVRDEIGIQFEDDISIAEIESGFQAITKFRIIHRSTINPIKIKLDITDSKNEQIILPVQRRPIFHNFSDRLEVSACSYALEEIMAEKIRSLFQRTRPRDLYDVWQLNSHVNHGQVKSIFHRKCECKMVKPDSSLFLERRDQFAAAWNTSLHHQMKEVPDFEHVYARMIEILRDYS